jgi:YidC/Oxa1 family membrane protein insertase
MALGAAFGSVSNASLNATLGIPVALTWSQTLSIPLIHPNKKLRFISMKTDWLRKSILGGILVIVFILFIRWNEFQEKTLAQIAPPVATTSQTPETSTTKTTGNEEFHVAPVASSATPTATDTAQLTTPKITVTTDSFVVDIDSLGGDISKVALRKYYAELHKADQPYVLLENNSARTYIARSGLTGPNGTDGNQGRPQFQTSKTEYVMAEGQNELSVDLSYQQAGAEITKRFIFTRDSHLIKVDYIIKNTSDQPWQASFVGSIKRDSYNPTRPQMFAMNPFLGAATSTDEKNYQKLSFSDIAEKPFKHVKEGGWIALVQHYFLTAWIPPQESKNTFVLQKVKDEDIYILSFTSEPFLVAANSEKTFQSGFYAGPKDIKALEKIAPHLDLTMDYSWLWWIAKPLFQFLSLIQSYVASNWGVAIILLTLCIKVLFFYPSAMSYKSMARMRKVQPKMLALKERYGDDRQKMSQELMKLYREEKVNPVSGCLPMIIQMPVFLALYWVLMEAVELRHAPFYLWITDLSVKDPYFVLPLIMGVTMYIQQKLNPTPPDPMQAKMMQMMPFFFTFLFVFFPAGLVLYWVVNNTLSIIQQYIITKQIEKT